jgi:prepilin-type N-terminal cleavage/methylation domain-containing protein
MNASAKNRGFTLIEIMLVVAIMGVVLAMGYPALKEAIHRAPLNQAVKDTMEGCRLARARAILKGAPAELRIYAGDGRIEVVDAPPDASPGDDPLPTAEAAPTRAAIVVPDDENKPKGAFSAQLPESVAIEAIGVNFVDLQNADVARVRFYANGTSDEFTLVFLADGERRKITLEVVTALASVERL